MNTDFVHSSQRTRRKFERDCTVRLGNVNSFFYEIRLLDAFCFTLGMADAVADHPSFTCNLAYTSHYKPPNKARNIEQTRRYVKDGLDRFGGESVGFLWRQRAVRTKNRESAIIAEFYASCGSFCVCQEFSQFSAWNLNVTYITRAIPIRNCPRKSFIVRYDGSSCSSAKSTIRFNGFSGISRKISVEVC